MPCCDPAAVQQAPSHKCRFFEKIEQIERNSKGMCEEIQQREDCQLQHLPWHGWRTKKGMQDKEDIPPPRLSPSFPAGDEVAAVVLEAQPARPQHAQRRQPLCKPIPRLLVNLRLALQLGPAAAAPQGQAQQLQLAAGSNPFAYAVAARETAEHPGGLASSSAVSPKAAHTTHSS